MTHYQALHDAILDCEETLNSLRSFNGTAPLHVGVKLWNEVKVTQKALSKVITDISANRVIEDWKADVAAGLTWLGLENWKIAQVNLNKGITDK